MKQFVKINAEGLVERVTSGTERPDGFLQVRLSQIPLVPPEIAVSMRMSAAGLARMRDTGGRLEDRPLSPVPSVAGNVVSIPPLMAGGVVRVEDRIGMEVALEITAPTDGYTEQITLEDPGTYDIEVADALPALPVILQVVVP